MPHTPSDLLDKLNACHVNFDPLFDHSDPRVMPRKVAFVPTELLAELQAHLQATKNPRHAFTRRPPLHAASKPRDLSRPARPAGLHH